uniref:Putative reverse transcriptase domain-containing protein n=1 Tax=Tanacetum cinerariifolium TaxID=118510 RepID=A0A6L2MVK5_TANCI|nr:putative reverse transcriptase domain-containing protein [Tanacetum cinerariifolium]
MTRDYTAAAAPNTQRAPVRNQSGVVCYECGRPRHFRKDSPKLRSQNRRNKIGNKTGNDVSLCVGNKNGNNEVTARAYAIRGGEANPDSNVVTCTFLLNNCYASLLFDDRSFVSSTFSALLDVAPSTLDTIYAVELLDGRILETNVILRGYWLAKYHAVIVCEEKIVHIPYGDDVFIIRGDDYDSGSKSKLSIILCTKIQKYIQKGCQVYLAQVTSKKAENKLEKKRLEDVPTVREFPEVFPEDLPRLPPTRQVEFQIDIVPGAAPVARAPYRLAAAKMQELSTQLQELSDKGFIRPSSSTWGAPVLFVKKKDGSFRMYNIQCPGSGHDHYQEAAYAHHEDHMMHGIVQLDHVVASHADYTSDSNIIMYDQYVKDNEVPVVHSDVSSVLTDAFMMIYDDMCEPNDQSVSYPSRNTAI